MGKSEILPIDESQLKAINVEMKIVLKHHKYLFNLLDVNLVKLG